MFINWLLTKDAQVGVGARGRDEQPAGRRGAGQSGSSRCPEGAKLFQVDAEENLPEVVKTQDIAKAVIK